MDDPGGVAAVAGHVVLDGADLAAPVSDRLRAPALERVDRARRLRSCPWDHEADAALERELAQIALLAGGRRRSCRCGGRVVIGHGRARARRAGPSTPWSVRTREATRRAGLDGPVCAPCYGWRTRPSTTRTADIRGEELRPACGFVAVRFRELGLAPACRAVALCHLRLSQATERGRCLLLDLGCPSMRCCGLRVRHSAQGCRRRRAWAASRVIVVGRTAGHQACTSSASVLASAAASRALSQASTWLY